MERVGTLINRLKEQFDQHQPAEQLMITTQLLLAELQPRVEMPVKSRVAVVMPAGPSFYTREEPVVAPDPVPVIEAAPLPAVEITNPLFEIHGDIPTLAHQDFVPAPEREPMEVNRVLAKETGSLNERFKEDRIEVATALQSTPIRDLKKGIGVNDRFLFVQDLFRGDENMYERSLKTINSFTIYPEAEYWIQRELKVKLSWPDNSETVQLFDQLVKRRFS